MKEIDYGLFDAGHKLFFGYDNIDNTIRIFETEKTVIPLMIQQHYIDYLKNGSIDLLNKISKSIAFGDIIENQVIEQTNETASGKLHLQRARVEGLLSIDYMRIPQALRDAEKRTYRTLQIEGEEIEFSDGFTELHTHSYKDIIDGHGFGLEEAMNSIQIVHNIRHSNPIGLIGDYHPLANGVLAKHPFSK
jgi:hypothetical protein